MLLKEFLIVATAFFSKADKQMVTKLCLNNAKTKVMLVFKKRTMTKCTD